MSTVPPNQPSPYSETSEVTAGTSGSSNTAGKIIIGLIVGALVLIFSCGGVLALLLLPAVSSARTAAERMSRTNLSKQVALACIIITLLTNSCLQLSQSMTRARY